MMSIESAHSVDKMACGASPKTGMGEGERCASRGKELGAMIWGSQVIPARYYLYSFQDIPAGPSIIPERIPAYLGIYERRQPLGGPMELRNRTKSRKIEANRAKSLEKWTLAARRSSYCVI